ncbi:hypothetical protein CVT25_004831 [Psilocybe cyanescens]|uniref:Asl1-like glycosyl hydrolase catalytic domain-containing protein n=1 Tax=Psilocybe cyanescens TaxID=93625 RepID=A0A409VT94_PSICY|nr:hypothetical protein CVT25_004831 [Psilocybe cyanescens]
MFARVSSLLLAFWVSLSVAHTKNPKRGLGYAGSVPGDVINANQSNSVLSWEYNWSNLPPDYLATSNIPYVPMQWGSVGADSFADDVKAQGAKTILSFNEPDFDQESNMLPEDAAKLWMQFLEPLKSTGVRLGGPAVTNSPTGRMDPDSTLSTATFLTSIINFLNIRFGSLNLPRHRQMTQASYAQFSRLFYFLIMHYTVVFNFMNTTITAMDTLPWIERYSWFGYFRPRPDVHYNMLNDDGSLNALGQLYTGAKTIHTEIITSAPTSTYKTVNGADNPTQAPATTWPSLLSSAPSTRGSVPASLQLFILVLSLVSGFFGLIWTAL